MTPTLATRLQVQGDLEIAPTGLRALSFGPVTTSAQELVPYAADPTGPHRLLPILLYSRHTVPSNAKHALHLNRYQLNQ